jgi:hypothetical protein
VKVGKEIGSQVAHVLVGAAILLPVAARPDWPPMWALSAFLTALVREDAQHRPSEGWRWPLEGTYRRWLDMGCWGILGGTTAWVFSRYVFTGG